MKIAMGSDHAGYGAKEFLKKVLSGKYEIRDAGTFSPEPCDYPEYARKVAELVASGSAERGILICGTGIGMSIAANKVRGIRAAVCYTEELARLSRAHNDANVLCIGARVNTEEEIEKIVRTWLSTEFEGGRHERRVKKILEIENSIPRVREFSF